MTDGFGFLAYVFTLPVLILGGISYVCIVFLIRFQSFCGFVCSKSFWIAWLFSYYLLFLIICITCEWELLIMYICGISLPLVYFLRKFYAITFKFSSKPIFIMDYPNEYFLSLYS